MKIIIAGGTGFIGRHLVNHLTKKGNEVIVLGRSCSPNDKNAAVWDGKTLGNWVEKLRGTEVLINLTGKSVDCRYTEKNKQEIIDSRINSISVLEKAFKQIKEQPKVWINSSTATIYREEYERENNEFSKRIGEGFSVDVAKKWEQTLEEVNLPNTRKIKLRITIVLGKNGGAFPVFKNMVTFGFGGKQGNGKQKFSWIHIFDLIKIIDLCIENKTISGAVNCSAPEIVTNKKFMKVMRKQMKFPFGIPIPELLLKMGAKIIGTEPELILKSRWVQSKKLRDLKFKFKFDTIEKAIENII